MRRPLLTAAFALVAAALAFDAGRARARDFDPAAEEKATFELLRELVRCDTRMANETRAIDVAKKWLDAAGIEHKEFERAPGRANLIARLKGAGKGAPLLLMAHVDTVNFDKAEGWSADPLGAEVRNGELVGRGVLDDKSDVAAALEAIVLLKREHVELARDVVVMLNADEENMGRFGAAWICSEQWGELAPLGGAIAEGGRCVKKDGKVRFVGIQTAEKIYNDVVVRVKGESGHSSVPRPGNAIAKLARVISKIEAWKPRLRVTPPGLGTFRGLAALETDEVLARAMKDLGEDDATVRERAAELLADHDPRWSALLRSTFAFTLLKGGIKENQLPPSAEVNLNVRLLPDEDIDELLVGLRHAIRDERGVEVEVVARAERSPMPSPEHALFKAIEAAAKKHYPDAVVAPILGTGATDMRQLRMRGVPAFGVRPFALEEQHERTVHANDERLPVASFGPGLWFYYDLVEAYATTPD